MASILFCSHTLMSCGLNPSLNKQKLCPGEEKLTNPYTSSAITPFEETLPTELGYELTAPHTIQESTNQVDINQLVGREFIAEGGHLVTFHEQGGQLKSDIRVDEVQKGPNYKNLPVYVDKDIDLSKLVQLDKKRQKKFIEVNLPKNGKIAHTYVGKRGLLGGMSPGPGSQLKNKKDENISPDQKKKDFKKKIQGLIEKLSSIQKIRDFDPDILKEPSEQTFSDTFKNQAAKFDESFLRDHLIFYSEKPEERKYAYEREIRQPILEILKEMASSFHKLPPSLGYLDPMNFSPENSTLLDIALKDIFSNESQSLNALEKALIEIRDEDNLSKNTEKKLILFYKLAGYYYDETAIDVLIQELEILLLHSKENTKKEKFAILKLIQNTGELLKPILYSTLQLDNQIQNPKIFLRLRSKLSHLKFIQNTVGLINPILYSILKLDNQIPNPRIFLRLRSKLSHLNITQLNKLLEENHDEIFNDLRNDLKNTQNLLKKLKSKIPPKDIGRNDALDVWNSLKNEDESKTNGDLEVWVKKDDGKWIGIKKLYKFFHPEKNSSQTKNNKDYSKEIEALLPWKDKDYKEKSNKEKSKNFEKDKKNVNEEFKNNSLKLKELYALKSIFEEVSTKNSSEKNNKKLEGLSIFINPFEIFLNYTTYFFRNWAWAHALKTHRFRNIEGLYNNLEKLDEKLTCTIKNTEDNEVKIKKIEENISMLEENEYVKRMYNISLDLEKIRDNNNEIKKLKELYALKSILEEFSTKNSSEKNKKKLEDLYKRLEKLDEKLTCTIKNTEVKEVKIKKIEENISMLASNIGVKDMDNIPLGSKQKKLDDLKQDKNKENDLIDKKKEVESKNLCHILKISKEKLESLENLKNLEQSQKILEEKIGSISPLRGWRFQEKLSELLQLINVHREKAGLSQIDFVYNWLIAPNDANQSKESKEFEKLFYKVQDINFSSLEEKNAHRSNKIQSLLNMIKILREVSEIDSDVNHEQEKDSFSKTLSGKIYLMNQATRDLAKSKLSSDKILACLKKGNTSIQEMLELKRLLGDNKDKQDEIINYLKSKVEILKVLSPPAVKTKLLRSKNRNQLSDLAKAVIIYDYLIKNNSKIDEWINDEVKILVDRIEKNAKEELNKLIDKLNKISDDIRYLFKENLKNKKISVEAYKKKFISCYQQYLENPLFQGMSVDILREQLLNQVLAKKRFQIEQICHKIIILDNPLHDRFSLIKPIKEKFSKEDPLNLFAYEFLVGTFCEFLKEVIDYPELTSLKSTLKIRNYRNHKELGNNEPPDISGRLTTYLSEENSLAQDLAVIAINIQFVLENLKQNLGGINNESSYSEEEKAKEESRKIAEGGERIGPKEIEGWELKNVNEKGNCFYDAIAHQMFAKQHHFCASVPKGTLTMDSLRLRVQGQDFKDEEWVDDKQIDEFLKKFPDILLAVVHTRFPQNGFTCYFYDVTKKNTTILSPQDLESNLPNNKNIMRLAYTGNHFLSVVKHPELEKGLITWPYHITWLYHSRLSNFHPSLK
mgnify:CR=1 FL=1